MGRLIDVDALKADYGMKDDCADCDKEYRWKSRKCEFDQIYSKMDFCGWLDNAPTVDAVPVRHGHWIYHPDWQEDGECGYECSECLRGVDVDYAYCPNCGAKMDGKDGEHHDTV